VHAEPDCDRTQRDRRSEQRDRAEQQHAALPVLVAHPTRVQLDRDLLRFGARGAQLALAFRIASTARADDGSVCSDDPSDAREQCCDRSEQRAVHISATAARLALRS
jgi:hypothetical protein